MSLWLPSAPAAYGASDSRAYIFSFPIRREKDLPDDFCLPSGLREFSYGAFLPQALADSPEHPSCPAHLILLTRSSLVLAPHPTSGEPNRIIPFRDLESVEYGHLLLLGWLFFVARSGVRRFPFNTRTSRPAEELLRKLVSLWAPSRNDSNPKHCNSCGGEPDLKFRNAERAALLPEERVLVRFFSPTLPTTYRAWGVFPVHAHEPGDSLAVTNRRLLWITERHQGGYERYGVIQRFTPLLNVTALSIEHSGSTCSIVCRLNAGGSWSIPFRLQSADAARAFVEQALPFFREGTTAR